MSNKGKWCFAWMAGQPDATGAARAALLKQAKWNPGETITVSFLDGDPVVQAKVREVATRWTIPGLAHLTIAFRDDTQKTDVRISFKFAGSWSMIGTTCRQEKDITKPTMNYGWLDANTADDEVRRVVLHEFGHALGLIHEHQNPAGGIKWNKRAVIDALSPFGVVVNRLPLTPSRIVALLKGQKPEAPE